VWLGGWGDGDVHSEFFELAHESAGLLIGGALSIVPVWPEVMVGNPISDDVVIGDEDVVTGGADSLLGATAASDLGMVGGQVGALGAGRGLGGLGQRDLQPDRAVAGWPGSAFAA
jgi:hypothetical protein